MGQQYLASLFAPINGSSGTADKTPSKGDTRSKGPQEPGVTQAFPTSAAQALGGVPMPRPFRRVSDVDNDGDSE